MKSLQVVPSSGVKMSKMMSPLTYHPTATYPPPSGRRVHTEGVFFPLITLWSRVTARFGAELQNNRVLDFEERSQNSAPQAPVHFYFCPPPDRLRPERPRLRLQQHSFESASNKLIKFGTKCVQHCGFSEAMDLRVHRLGTTRAFLIP